MTKFLAIVLSTFSLLFGAAQAQETPEQVATTYFETLKSDGIEAAPRFIHPKELERFKSMLLPLFTAGGSTDNLSTLFFGEKKTPEEISAMAPSDFMSGFLSLAGAQLKSSNINLDKITVIGKINEGETVHVLIRSSTGNDTFKLTKVEVISMIPDGNNWKLLLFGEMEEMVQVIKSQLQKTGE